MGIDFSQDGRRVAYVAYPERTLWRCNTDGSEQLQLTFPPLKVIQPRWSPDGTRIAFMAQESFKPFRVYVIPADGGSPEQPTPSDRRGADPTWSTDGSSLLFGHPPGDEPPGALLGLEVVDLRTHAISKVPGLRGALVSPLVAGWTVHPRHFTSARQAYVVRGEQPEVGRVSENQCKLAAVVSQRRLHLFCWAPNRRPADWRISRPHQGSQAGTSDQPQGFSPRP